MRWLPVVTPKRKCRTVHRKRSRKCSSAATFPVCQTRARKNWRKSSLTRTCRTVATRCNKLSEVVGRCRKASEPMWPVVVSLWSVCGQFRKTLPIKKTLARPGMSCERLINGEQPFARQHSGVRLTLQRIKDHVQRTTLLCVLRQRLR